MHRMIKSFALLLVLATTTVMAKETIYIQGSAAATQSNWVPYRQMLKIANEMQNKYEFVLEFKPGGSGVVAINAMNSSPKDRLSTIGPPYLESLRQGALNESDYIAVTTQGDTCWGVITNVGENQRGVESLRGTKEINLGTVGIGSSAHLTALSLGEKLGFRVNVVLYKANFDALVNMASGENINMVIERVSSYKNFLSKNPNLRLLGVVCNQRNPQAPEVRTLAEQGYNATTIWFATVANKNMPENRRNEISDILNRAQEKLGNKYLLESADLSAPMFSNPKVSAQDFVKERTRIHNMMADRFDKLIAESKK